MGTAACHAYPIALLRPTLPPEGAQALLVLW